MARRENKSTPKLYSGVLYDDEGSFSISDVDRWQVWLSTHRTFYVEMPAGTFTARRELRSGGWYWYAYRRRGGRLCSLYLGQSHDLTLDRLAAAVVELDRKLVLPRG